MNIPSSRGQVDVFVSSGGFQYKAGSSARRLVVLTRGLDYSQGLTDAHAALAKQSTNSRHTVVAGAGHEIHLFKPAVVVQAVRDVLDSVGNEKKLAER